MAYEREVHYYETDQMAVVHHSNYIRWFEEARTAYMAQMGFSYLKIEQAGLQIPVLEVACAYKSMVRFGERVCIQVKITEYTGTRMTISYVITEKASGRICTTGQSRHCFIWAGGKPCSLKKALPEAHEAFLKGLITL